MKKLVYLLILFVVIILNSCGSDEGDTYFEIKTNYKEFINSQDSDIVNLDLKAQKINAQMNAFVSDYPESEYKDEITKLEENFEKQSTEKLYQSFLNKYERLKNENFEEYEDKMIKIDEIINDGEYISLKSKILSYNAGIEKVINELKTKKQKILTEQTEYNILSKFFKKNYSLTEADIESEAIKIFEYKYPKSVKTKELSERLQDLTYVKFKIYAERKPINIKELNDIIDTCTLYKDEIKTKKYIKKCSKFLEKLQDSRNKIFKKEWLAGKDSLILKMEQKAKDFTNENVHEFCENILNIKTVSKEIKDYNEKSIYVYEYELQSKCGFGCSKICLTQISVTGVLSGNKESGIEYELDAQLISDKKI